MTTQHTQDNTTAHTIDAQGQRLGRMASQIAVLLMGKDRPDFAANTIAPVTVVVNNASLMDIDNTKKDTKIYDRYSGYPGGRKEMTMREVIEKKGYAPLIENAVYGMLPGNKLRKQVMKNLIINE